MVTHSSIVLEPVVEQLCLIVRVPVEEAWCLTVLENAAAPRRPIASVYVAEAVSVTVPAPVEDLLIQTATESAVGLLFLIVLGCAMVMRYAASGDYVE